ncbi:MAG: hypothetical protein ACE5GW_12570 [Planctomycetota bacterium]
MKQAGVWSRVHAVAAITLFAVLAGGCVSPGYDEREALLHRESISVEPKMGIFRPNESDFDTGIYYGTKLSYEYQRYSYVSVEVSFVEVDQDVVPTATSFTSVNQIRGLKHQLIDDTDRLAGVVSLDWDIPLGETPHRPYLKAGIGVGALYVNNRLNLGAESSIISNGLAGKAQARDQAMFLVRPNFGIGWSPTGNNLSIFAEASYDHAMHNITIALDSSNYRTDAVNFSGFNFVAGISYKF